MRVLQIEADATAAQSVELMLKPEGFVISTTSLGEEGIMLAKDYDHDLILLGSGLPDMSGMHLLCLLRMQKLRTPVLVVHENASVDMKVKALNAGADDYLTSPFHKDELIARIRAIARRSNGHADSVITTGNLSVDLNKRVVSVCGARLSLVHREFRVLELLSLRKGTVVTRDTLMDHLYAGLDEPQEKILDIYLSRLRKKIASANHGNSYIGTVRSEGFILRDPLDAQQAVE